MIDTTINPVLLMKDCLFCDIIEQKIPSHILFEDSELIAFSDINPQAPVHFLIVPKQHIANINEADSKHEQLLGKMLLTAKSLTQKQGIQESGYRLVFNVREQGGQEVPHIHLHVLGGRQLTWPPG